MSWCNKTLGEICDYSGGLIQTGPFGSQLHQRDYVEYGIPVVMPKDIKDGSIREDGIANISVSKAEQLSRHFLYEGDIVFPRRGEISKRAFVNDNRKFLCGTGCLKITLPLSEVLPMFLFYFLDQRYVVQWLEGRAIGSTMLNLNTSIMRSVEIRYPSLTEQQAIVDILTPYDDLIENNRRRIELLEEAARQLYKEWFVRFRFPSHEHVRIIDGVPEGWESTTTDHVIEVLSGGTPTTTVRDYWGGEIPFFTPKDSTGAVYIGETEKSLTELGLAKCASRLYPKDTLFITARGTVGKLNLAQEPMAMNQSCYALLGKPPLTQFFLYFSLGASIQQVKGRAVGTVFDAVIKDTFKVIPFLLPAELLINKFTDYATPIIRQIDALLIANRKLTQTRDLLLPKLMSGEIAA